jgi:hypothetical protein
VQMSPISYLDEWERLELIELRYRIVEAMSRLAMDLKLDARVWAIYILLNYAKLPEDLVLKLISTTPETPPAEEPGMESLSPRMRTVLGTLSPEQRTIITEDMRPTGFYTLSVEEQTAIAQAMHRSPELRKIVGDIAYYHEGDATSVLWEAAQQMDPSILPVVVGGQILEDDYSDEPEAQALKNDKKTLMSKP